MTTTTRPLAEPAFPKPLYLLCEQTTARGYETGVGTLRGRRCEETAIQLG